MLLVKQKEESAANLPIFGQDFAKQEVSRNLMLGKGPRTNLVA
jgi:hypothetical protein